LLAPPDAHHSLGSAFIALRAARGAAAVGLAPPPATVELYGTCYEPLHLTVLDSRVTVRAAPGVRAAISAAVPLMASDFAPVTDAGILAQLPAAARGAVRRVDLRAAGVPLAPLGCQGYVGGNSVMTPGLLLPAGAEIFAYGDPRANGDAGALTPARYPNADAGGPTAAWGALFGVFNGSSARLELDVAAAARAPLWAQQLREDPGSLRAKQIGELGWDEHTQALVSVGGVTPPAAPAACAATTVEYTIMGSDVAGSPFRGVASAGECCARCGARTNCRFWSWQPPGNAPNAGWCYLKFGNYSGQWARVGSGIVTGTTPVARAGVDVRLGAPCAGTFEDTYGDGAVVLLTNALAELDEPGEYTINRTAGVAYVWLPAQSSDWSGSAPWGAAFVVPEGARHRGAPPPPPRADADAPVAYVSAAPHALELDGATDLSFEGVVIEGAQDAALVARGALRVTFSDCLLQNAGNMVVNVTRGSGVALVRCTVRGGANGAALLEGGDRAALAPGAHAIVNSTLSYASRGVWLNAPMVSLDGVAHAIEGSEVFGGPHMGIYHSGNLHRIARNDIHDVVQACDDCGAVYGGRDWAYQGTRIVQNTLRRLHSSEGLDASAVYLDDMISGITVEDNVFVNVSRALELGGGRWISFARNTIRGVTLANDAVAHFDNRGMNWANPSCNLSKSVDPNMIMLLNRVPYNTSAMWLETFPELANILNDEPCTPKYNAITNNTYCFVDTDIPFLDATFEQIVAWGSTASGNVNATDC
jgi:hypothetical protein